LLKSSLIKRFYSFSICSVLTEQTKRNMMSAMETRQFVEDMGVYFELNGLTRMAGRIIGWLLVCDPPHQTMPQIIEALDASKSAVSVALTTLHQINLIHRLSLPGERKDYFRLNPDMWTHAFMARANQITALRILAERGLALMEGASPESKRRLQLVWEMNVFMEAEFPRLIERWNEVKKAKGLDDL
jgi:DNA-binding transcriptional regulator GbsR (MarR family)